MDLGRIQPESYKIKKISHQDTEMQELYFKLKELVPNCADKNKMSKTELLQHVIDYIFDLQDTLEIEDTDVSREPLTEKLQSNQMDTQVNILSNVFITLELPPLFSIVSIAMQQNRLLNLFPHISRLMSKTIWARLEVTFSLVVDVVMLSTIVRASAPSAAAVARTLSTQVASTATRWTIP